MKKELSPFWLLLLLLLIGCGWGLTVPLATVAMSRGDNPIVVALWGALIAFALLSINLLVRGERPPLDGAHLRFYVIVGLLGTALPHSLSFHAASHLPAGLRAIAFAMIPMMTLLLSIGIGLERPSLKRFAGICLGFLAVALILAPDASAKPIDGHVFWMLVALLAAACYAFEGVYIAQRRPEGLNALTALWGMNLAAIVMLTVFLVTSGTEIFIFRGLQLVELSIAAMAIVHLACYAALLFLLQRGGAVFASQVAYIITPAAVFWGAMILSEKVTAVVLMSTVIILAGLVLIRPERKIAEVSPATSL